MEELPICPRRKLAYARPVLAVTVKVFGWPFELICAVGFTELVRVRGVVPVVAGRLRYWIQAIWPPKVSEWFPKIHCTLSTSVKFCAMVTEAVVPAQFVGGLAPEAKVVMGKAPDAWPAWRFVIPIAVPAPYAGL